MDRYVIVLCARQSLANLRRRVPEFFAEHKGDDDALALRVKALCEAQHAKLQSDGLGADFLAWFEREFLRGEKTGEACDANG